MSGFRTIAGVGLVGLSCFGLWAWRARHECTELFVRNNDKRTYGHVSILVGEARLEVAETLPPNAELQTRVCEGAYAKWYLEYLGPEGGLVGPKFLDSVYLDVPEKERVELVFTGGEAHVQTCPATSLACGSAAEDRSLGRAGQGKR